MRKFIQKALNALPRLDSEQIRSLINLLTSENELLEMVLGSLPDGMIVCDTNNKITFLNKHIERMIPLAPGDKMEKTLWEIIRDEDIAAFTKKALDEQELVVDKDFTMDDPEPHITISCSIFPLVSKGSIHGSLFLVKDVTEKRNQDIKLRRAESLASLTTMAAGVAHEIKNPLGSMGIHVQLMQKLLNNQASPDVETMKEYLEVVNEEIDRLNGIVVDFLFAVRPMDAHLKDTDLNKIILDLINFMHFELEEEEIDYEMGLDRNLPDLSLDERYIKQALLNIIKNAVYAMEDGGILKITTERKNNKVVLTIKDNGCGIPEEIKRKIFEPYFTTKHSGSGLGLTLVFKILKEHDADIQLSSKEGEGSIFTITFPIKQKNKKMIEWEGQEDEV